MLNRILMMGHLTRDPQLSYLPSQTPVVEFGLASSRKFKKQDGTTAEDTCFVECRLFGKRADVVNKYFKKGSPMLVEGRLQYQTWEKDGQKRSKHIIFVENFEFIGKPEKSEPATGAATGAEPPIPDDDIPF